MRSIFLMAAAIAIAVAATAQAQTRVHTETVRPPPPATALPSATPHGGENAAAGAIPPAAASAPEIITDVSRLPPAVARTRERILAAARSGELNALLEVMQSNGTMPIFSLHGDKDPIAYWRSDYPDSSGIEVLAILTEILETGCAHVGQGTAEEGYVWPYFARIPISGLTLAQKVELFKIVTGADYKNMFASGSYNFFSLGISKDGVWRFFVTGQ
jgi:hypothetical protein